LICGFILAFTGVRAGEIADHEIDNAVGLATASLQREMLSLQEQLELFEMKHETLQAASEQFRMQSKSAKAKLEGERNRNDILVSEKEYLESSIENKVAIALEDQKATFEETIAAELIEKKNLLAKENEELSKKLRRSEYQVSMLEESMKDKTDEQSKRYEISEGKRLASVEKLRAEITILTKRLSSSEKQSKSYEESWKIAVTESEEKDDYFQEESRKRLSETSRWEQRLQKLNAESKDLYEDNKAKEIELIRSKKLHLTLLEKLQTSEETVKYHEAKIETFTSEIAKLSNDLKSASSELKESKTDHSSLSDKFENLNNLHQDTEFMLKKVRIEGEKNAAKNEKLQNELVDVKFELETSEKKTKRTSEEKSEMTKAYTEALEHLTSKNSFLRSELIDIKFELEQSHNETDTLTKETFEMTITHKKALDRLEIEGKKLASLQIEYSTMKREFEIITHRFNVSEEKVKNFQQQIKEDSAVNEELQKELLYAELKVESSHEKEKQLGDENSKLLNMYEEIQKSLGNSQTKVLETEQHYNKSQEHVEMLQQSLDEFEEKVEELIEQLELKVAKNSYLQKSLLDTKYNLEESKSKVKMLEAQLTETSTTNDEQVGALELENKEMMVRAQALERELQASSSLYNSASHKISELQDQLKATETRSTQMLNMYESMKENNDVLSRSLRVSEEDKSEFHLANIELHEKNESFEQCGKDLRGTKTEYSKLMQEYSAAKERIEETEEKALLQEDVIDELKTRKSELETIVARRKKDLEHSEDTKSEYSKLMQEYDATKERIFETEERVLLQEDVIVELKSRKFELETIVAQREKDLEHSRDTNVEYSKLMRDYGAAKERIFETEEKILLQEDVIDNLKSRQSELETIVAQHEKDLKHSESLEVSDAANDHLIVAKPDTSEMKTSAIVEDRKGEADVAENDVTVETKSKSEASAVQDSVKDTHVSESTDGRNEREIEKKPRRGFFSIFRWLDYTLYTILRVVVDLGGFLANGLWQMLTTSNFMVRLVTPFKSFLAIASWTMNELRIIHDALVSLFEFEMTFVSSLMSSEKDRTGFLFLIRHSETFVMFGEAIAMLLCIDFVVSSFLNPIRARKRRPKAKTIRVPKTATASLLRKANNM